MQTGRMILLCIQAGPGQTAPNLNNDLIRFIGVVTLTTICLIQYFSAEAGRRLNRYLAVLKITFLFILIVAGGVKTNETQRDKNGHPIDMSDEWHTWFDTKSDLNFAKALLAVLFSFEGWENATFVAGEIPVSRQHVLRKGFMIAVFVVGVLYLCVTSVFLDAVPYEFISGVDGVGQNVFYAPMFFGNGPTAKRAWAILAAFSSLGSLNSIIYTFSRVKQAIGQANILPWSKIWRKDDLMRRQNKDDLMHKSPQGGLILHWIMSVVVIVGSSSIKNTIESVSLPGYLQTYTHCFILMVMSAGFLRLPSREIALKRKAPTNIWRPSQVTGISRYFIGASLCLYGLVNLTLLVVNAIPLYRASDGKDSGFKGFGFPAIMFSIIVFGITYYFFVFGASSRYYPSGRLTNRDDDNPNPEPREREEGLFSPGRWWNVLSWAHVSAEVRKDYKYNKDLERVHRFGRRWRMRWILERKYRHPETEILEEEGEALTVDGDGDGTPSSTHDYLNFLYWVFGGNRWLSKTPWERVKEKRDAFADWVKSFWPDADQ